MPSDTKQNTPGLFNLFLFGYFFILVYIAVIFFLGQMIQAAQKPFWGDELFGLQASIRSPGYFDLILKGAPGQGSPSPLDYILVKFLDQIKSSINFFDLKDEVYLRLVANGAMLLTGLTVVFVLTRQILKREGDLFIKSIQLILLPGVLISFLFSSTVYYYAAETRPYALWASLWFLSLGAASITFLKKEFSPWLIASLTLLGISATTSFFQIGSLAAAYFFVCYIQKDPIKKIFQKMLKIFLIPVILNLYYTFKVGQWSTDVPGTWQDFFSFWSHKSTIVPLMLVAAAGCFIKQESRRLAAVPLAVLLLYLLGPVIFKLTLMKGFFYTERQYIYYDVVNAVFLLILVQCLPLWLKGIHSRPVYVGIIVFTLAVSGSVVFKKKIVRKFNLARSDTIQLLNNPSLIQK